MDLHCFLNVLAASVLFLTLACQCSSLARFYVKSAFVYGSMFWAGVATVPYGLLYFKQFHKTCLFAGARIRFASDVLGIRWEIDCEEEVDKKKSYIVVSNHQSAIDVLGMMRVMPTLGHTVAAAKSELQYFGPFSLALYLCGTIFIDRHSIQGRQAVNEASRYAKESGTSIWIFPEGTRNRKRDRSMLPFKKGAFHMAIDAGLPILPVVFSEYDFFNPREKRFDSGVARIRVLKPISTEGFAKDSLDSLVDTTRERMIEALETISSSSRNSNSKKDS